MNGQPKLAAAAVKRGVKKTAADVSSDNQSMHSHFSHATNKTAATYMPILRSSSGSLKPEKALQKRKLSDGKLTGLQIDKKSKASSTV